MDENFIKIYKNFKYLIESVKKENIDEDDFEINFHEAVLINLKDVNDYHYINKLINRILTLYPILTTTIISNRDSNVLDKLKTEDKYLKQLFLRCKKCTKRATHRVFIRPAMSLDIRPVMTVLIRPLCA